MGKSMKIHGKSMKILWTCWGNSSIGGLSIAMVPEIPRLSPVEHAAIAASRRAERLESAMKRPERGGVMYSSVGPQNDAER